MVTEKLYENNSYLKEEKAKIIKIGNNEGQYLVLDKTVFFPEGGGQPWDEGTINEIKVDKVLIEEDEIRHYCKGDFEENEVVELKINWERRFDLMVQHTGEHLLCGVIHKLYGFDNVGFHMGADFITMDIDGVIPKEDLQKVELMANKLIWENHEIKAFVPSEDELKKINYRSKKEISEKVRIVEIEDVDICACCGTPVKTTGEIGLIKIISTENFRGGSRFTILSGERAYKYLSNLYKKALYISRELSVPVEKVQEGFEKLRVEYNDAKEKINESESGIRQLLVEKYTDRGSALIFRDGISPINHRKLADEIMEVCCGVCGVFNKVNENTYQYIVCYKGEDIRKFVAEMNKALNGKGGGKPSFCQGSVNATKEDIEKFFKE